ncbi:hypothetical protein Q7P35_002450 [Cladosporium inversicolor]
MDLRILQPYISVATACLDLVVNGTTRLKSPDLPRRITISIAIEHLGKCMRPNGPSFAKYDLMIMAQQTVDYQLNTQDNIISINAKSLLLAATLLGGSFVKADWASISEKGYGIGTCPDGGNILSPVFEDDAFDGMCEDLVTDGNAGVGWTQFTGAEAASCEEKAPLGHLTCTNQFRNAYISSTVTTK